MSSDLTRVLHKTKTPDVSIMTDGAVVLNEKGSTVTFIEGAGKTSRRSVDIPAFEVYKPDLQLSPGCSPERATRFRERLRSAYLTEYIEALIHSALLYPTRKRATTPKNIEVVNVTYELRIQLGGIVGWLFAPAKSRALDVARGLRGDDVLEGWEVPEDNPLADTIIGLDDRIGYHLEAGDHEGFLVYLQCVGAVQLPARFDQRSNRPPSCS